MCRYLRHGPIHTHLEAIAGNLIYFRLNRASHITVFPTAAQFVSAWKALAGRSTILKAMAFSLYSPLYSISTRMTYWNRSLSSIDDDYWAEQHDLDEQHFLPPQSIKKIQKILQSKYKLSSYVLRSRALSTKSNLSILIITSIAISTDLVTHPLLKTKTADIDTQAHQPDFPDTRLRSLVNEEYTCPALELDQAYDRSCKH